MEQKKDLIQIHKSNSKLDKNDIHTLVILKI